ncbi:hypothetical protein BVX98_03415, partial [bacterium F11]
FRPNDVNKKIKHAVDPTKNILYGGTVRINDHKPLKCRAPLPHALLRVSTTSVNAPELLHFEGTAKGDLFAKYSLEYGVGTNPADWYEIHTSTRQINNGMLYGNFDPLVLDDGIYTFRLLVWDSMARVREERIGIQVDYFDLTLPRGNDIRRRGDIIEIVGNIRIPFNQYSLSYGMGLEPTEWMTKGISLTKSNGGTNMEGLLGRWNTSQAPRGSGSMDDFYTIRLTVETNSGPREIFINMVYLDDKLKSGWPLHFSSEEYGDGPFITRVADLDKDGKKEIIFLRENDIDYHKDHNLDAR